MSVFPQFLDHIHEMGMYVDGYNYEEMYNIMVYNLTYNIISTNNFVYTYAQMNQLYDYLEELLLPDSDTEPETNPSININTITQPTNQDTTQLFNNYILTTLNNQYNQNLNQTNINQTNMNNLHTNNEFTYTNLVYYNNI